METKPFWQSVTFWGAVGTVLSGLLGTFPELASFVADPQTAEQLAGLGVFISAIVSIFGRARANKPLSVKKGTTSA